jgi:hypothetical protein
MAAALTLFLLVLPPFSLLPLVSLWPKWRQELHNSKHINVCAFLTWHRASQGIQREKNAPPLSSALTLLVCASSRHWISPARFLYG